MLSDLAKISFRVVGLCILLHFFSGIPAYAGILEEFWVENPEEDTFLNTRENWIDATLYTWYAQWDVNVSARTKRPTEEDVKEATSDKITTIVYRPSVVLGSDFSWSQEKIGASFQFLTNRLTQSVADKFSSEASDAISDNETWDLFIATIRHRYLPVVNAVSAEYGHFKGRLYSWNVQDLRDEYSGGEKAESVEEKTTSTKYFRISLWTDMKRVRRKKTKLEDEAYKSDFRLGLTYINYKQPSKYHIERNDHTIAESDFMDFEYHYFLASIIWKKRVPVFEPLGIITDFGFDLGPVKVETDDDEKRNETEEAWREEYKDEIEGLSLKNTWGIGMAMLMELGPSFRFYPSKNYSMDMDLLYRVRFFSAYGSSLSADEKDGVDDDYDVSTQSLFNVMYGPLLAIRGRF